MRSVLYEGLLLGRRRRDPRAAGRDRARARARPAVQGLRRRPAGQRHRARDADDRRVAARRRRRDRARRPAAGAARHARAAAGGDARGRRDPAAHAAHARTLRRPDPARAIALVRLVARRSPRAAAPATIAIIAAIGAGVRLRAAAPARPGPPLPARPGRWRGRSARSCAGAASPAGSREENSIRQPGRTLVTAAALTVGLALVTFVAVLADGTKATIDQAVSRSFAGNLIVENSSAGTEQGIPAAVAPRCRAGPGGRHRHADRLHASGACAAARATPRSRRSNRPRSRASTGSNGSRARNATLLGARRRRARSSRRTTRAPTT